ncbi:hypothetical protein [Streptomyces sp. NPDC017086]|uniref:hypothetical protein n=1 Tax=unclassified Streptomyces TaxID=2593676 RepID=UPI0037B32777
MSTEARHVPVPPRPPAPPPAPAGTGEPAHGTVPHPAADLDDEPSVFTPRAARLHSPRSSAVPEATAPVSPPPPPASARFPDAPPSAGTGGRPGTLPGRPAAPARTVAAAAGDTAARPATDPGPRTEPPRRTPPADTPPGASAHDGLSVGGAFGAVTGVESGSPGGGAGAFGAAAGSGPGGSPRREVPGEGPSETTTRLRPVPPGAGPVPGRAWAWSPAGSARPERPAAPDPARSWSSTPAARPVVSFAEPDVSGAPRRLHVGARTVAAAACLVLGLGLVGGALTGSWLTGDGGDDGVRTAYTTAGTLWHSLPVDDLFPPTVQGKDAGPGGADRTWTRIAVAPDSGCAQGFDPLLRRILAPVGCRRLLRATYTDATQSHVTTVGLLFTKADPAAMSALAARFRAEHLDRRADLMPRPYAAAGTAAAGFGDRQRAAWTLSVRTDAPVVAYAVSGWADARTVDAPQPAADAVRSGAVTAPAQAGLGHEAMGLADRIGTRLSRSIGRATEKPA